MFTDTSLLFRQIHPNWFADDGEITSQAFLPTKKDKNKLSTYDGTMLIAQQSYYHYTEILCLASDGVMAITRRECQDQKLCVAADPMPEFDEHVSVIFPAELSNSEKRDREKYLKEAAKQRGWQFKP